MPSSQSLGRNSTVGSTLMDTPEPPSSLEVPLKYPNVAQKSNFQLILTDFDESLAFSLCFSTYCICGIALHALRSIKTFFQFSPQCQVQLFWSESKKTSSPIFLYLFFTLLATSANSRSHIGSLQTHRDILYAESRGTPQQRSH